ncbi:MAG: hypothetical protein ABR587_00190, partial [Candidatus Binatia bacterium]
SSRVDAAHLAELATRVVDAAADIAARLEPAQRNGGAKLAETTNDGVSLKDGGAHGFDAAQTPRTSNGRRAPKPDTMESASRPDSTNRAARPVSKEKRP